MSLLRDPTSTTTSSPEAAESPFSPTRDDIIHPQPPDPSRRSSDEGDKHESDYSSQTKENPADVPIATRPHFKPFFTVIGDARSSAYYHPQVHYIFSDDDTGMITDAALRSLEENRPRNLWDSESKPQKDAKKGKTHQDSQSPAERFIVLDVEPVNNLNETAGVTDSTKNSPQDTPYSHRNFRITSAHSLSPSWQVINTTLSPAPNFESSPDGPTSINRDAHPVLMIEGTSGFTSVNLDRKQQHTQQTQTLTLEEKLGQFSKHMEELRMVVEASGDAPLVPIAEHAKSKNIEAEE